MKKIYFFNMLMGTTLAINCMCNSNNDAPVAHVIARHTRTTTTTTILSTPITPSEHARNLVYHLTHSPDTINKTTSYQLLEALGKYLIQQDTPQDREIGLALMNIYHQHHDREHTPKALRLLRNTH